MILLAFVFAAAWTVTGAMAAHLPRIMEAAGATTAQAVFAGALIGPAQVAARIFEASFLSRYHPLVSTRLACLTHPIGAAILGLAGGGAASVFAIFHGAGNGILTIARGTLPLAIFGPENYGYRLGIIGAPARMAQAAAPLLFGLLIDSHGQPRPDRLLRAQPCGAAGAVPAARRPSASGRERKPQFRPSLRHGFRATTTRWKTRPVRRLTSEGFVRWAITPPQSYAVYLVCLFLVAGTVVLRRHAEAEKGRLASVRHRSPRRAIEFQSRRRAMMISSWKTPSIRTARRLIPSSTNPALR